ncbi:MAG: hypothetical protein JOZ19_00530 [Rubrobacter sp.]|nr:hypothetical protein [Rubrobacter sp.]
MKTWESRQRAPTTREAIEQAIEAAGWRTDDGFSAHLLVGNDSTVSVLAHHWVWGTDDPVFELSDEQTELTYWVREIPPPRRAAQLVEEHGQPADKKRGNRYKQE